MTIAGGLAGLKAAAELTKALRDAAKSGVVKPDEFAGRVSEIYDYIIESRVALADAQEELQNLKYELKALRDTSAIAADLVFDVSPIGENRRGNPPSARIAEPAGMRTTNSADSDNASRHIYRDRHIQLGVRLDAVLLRRSKTLVIDLAEKR